MADLTMSTSFIEEVSVKTRNAAAELAFPAALAGANAGAIQSDRVANALRESSAERDQRASLTATAIHALASSASNASTQMTASDVGLARQAL